MLSNSQRFESRLPEPLPRPSVLALFDLAINFLLCSGILGFACLLLHVILTRNDSPFWVLLWNSISHFWR